MMTKIINNGLYSFILVMLLIQVEAVDAGGNLKQHNTGDNNLNDTLAWQNTQNPIMWHLSSNGYFKSGLSNLQLQEVIQSAFDTWELIPTSNISFTYGG